MALAGTQIGGISLIVHIIVIVFFRLKTIAANFHRKTFRQVRLNAR